MPFRLASGDRLRVSVAAPRPVSVWLWDEDVVDDEEVPVAADGVMEEAPLSLSFSCPKRHWNAVQLFPLGQGMFLRAANDMVKNGTWPAVVLVRVVMRETNGGRGG